MSDAQYIEQCLLSGKFYYDEPIVLSKSCAMVFGVDTAIMAQQFVFWVFSRKCRLDGEVLDDRKWVYFSHQELLKEFPWMKMRTLRRRLELLEACGFLIVRRPQRMVDTRNRYTVNHGILAAIESGKVNHLNEEGKLVFHVPVDEEDVEPPVQIDQSANFAYGQIEQGVTAKLATSLTTPISPSDISVLGGKPGTDHQPKATGLQEGGNDRKGPNNPNLEANPEAEPTGSGRETPPVPRPPLTDKYADARKVLAHLNAATGRRYRETDSNLKLIRGRLLEPGVDVGGCLQVIDRQCAKWLKDPKMAEYLRPETLFGKTKFDSYYAAKDEPVVPLTPRAPLTSQPKKPWQIRNDTKDELGRIENALRKHPGYGESDVYIPDWATEAQRADAARLVERRKELKAILASLPAEL
jgi:uncharacterized phage protein (TIGR02220 family)